MSTPLTLGRLAGRDSCAALLAGRGLSPPAQRAKLDLFARVAGSLVGAGRDASSQAWAFFVPGRIEVLGKHTDYAGGSSILAAAERGFCLVSCGRDDDAIRMTDVSRGEQAQFAFRGDLAPQVGHWSNYPMTVARRLARNFPGPLRGADIALVSDLPPAAGMSSSSAFMVATFLALAQTNDLGARREYRREIDDAVSLAQYLGCVENGQSLGHLAGDKGVGTFGGSEDHTCMLCAQPGRLVQYAYCPARFEASFALADDLTFAIASSGVVAAKTGNAMEKYNLASRLAAAAAGAWRDATGRDDPHLAAVLASEAGAMDRLRAVLAGAAGPGFTAKQLLDRAEHFYAENGEIMLAATAALDGGDWAQFGRAVDRSQELSDTLLGNQVPETILLARAAREGGAIAASAFGAGFGGSVWALVRASEADAFVAQWRAAYAQAYPQHEAVATFFTTRPGPAALGL